MPGTRAMTIRIPELPLEAFPTRSVERFRYNDTDRQGHINNAVFAILCQTGRLDLVEQDLPALERSSTQFVIVSLAIDFLREMHWPGEAVIGTGVTRVGSSSLALRQGIYFEGECAGMADSVIVLMDMQTRRTAPLPDELKERYRRLQIAMIPDALSGMR
jgi:acyl-CoA thioester hydrolase